MVYFADDNAHCEGQGCDIRGKCLRYVALMSKRGTGRLLNYCQPDPRDCELFWEVDYEVVSTTTPQSARTIAAKVRTQVSANAHVGVGVAE